MSQRPTILCVDDEKTILDALKEQLNRHFKREYTIECAENGEKALELYKELVEEELEIPVIISDHIMPGMKGDELLKQIYLLNPRIKKILLTGQADADAVGRAVNYASLYRYIPKPWEQHDLTLTIQEAIRSYYQDKTLEEQNTKLSHINDNLTDLNLQLEQKITLFNKFVPNQFLKILKIDLEKHSQDISKEAHDYIELAQCAERELTVLFADIRSFTAICESLTSSQAFDFINSYLYAMGPIISQYNGFIDKFIGDAIMALFVNADDAVQASIAMQQQLVSYNKQLEAIQQKPIAIGIGINTDTVMLGTLGEENRLQTTVIGDAVNLAQRTETKSKEFSTKIVITENSYKKLGNYSNFKFRFLDRARVKGKQQMQNFYEVLNLYPEEIQLKKWELSDLYQKGVVAFHNKALSDAESIFTECLKIYSEDIPSQHYLKETRKAIKENDLLVVDGIQQEDQPDSLSIKTYLKFWGTRGSSPVSGLEYAHFGGCTSCLELRNKDDVIIFDAGSGIRPLGEGLLLEKNREIHLIISHFHWDHIGGFPFFLPIYANDFKIHIYAPGDEESIREKFSTLLSPQFFPVELSALRATLTFHSIDPSNPIKINDVTIHSCQANHPGLTYCFKVEMPGLTFSYTTDNEFLYAHQDVIENNQINLEDPIFAPYREQLEFFKGCEMMIHEAQYLTEEYKKKTGWGHSSVDNALVLMRIVKPKVWILTHHDPEETDKDLLEKQQLIQKKLQYYGLDCDIELAIDGEMRPLE